MPEKPDLRVYLAAERTLLAWIRTGLALMGFGFVVARFGLFLREMKAVQTSGLSVWFGTALVLLGVAVNLGSAVEYTRVLRRLDRGEAGTPARSRVGIALAIVLGTLGLAMAAYLAVSR